MKTIVYALTLLIGLSSCQLENRKELEKLKEEIKMKKEIAHRNKANSIAFLKALENKNVGAVLDLFAKNGEHINPYASGLFPDGAKGHSEIRTYWEPVFPNFERMEFPIDEIYAMEDVSKVYIKFKGKIELKNNAGWYENDYYAIFKFNEEGKITEYVEIFNPIVAARGFGLIDKIK